MSSSLNVMTISFREHKTTSPSYFAQIEYSGELLQLLTQLRIIFEVLGQIPPAQTKFVLFVGTARRPAPSLLGQLVDLLELLEGERVGAQLGRHRILRHDAGDGALQFARLGFGLDGLRHGRQLLDAPQLRVHHQAALGKAEPPEDLQKLIGGFNPCG